MVKGELASVTEIVFFFFKAASNSGKIKDLTV